MARKKKAGKYINPISEAEKLGVLGEMADWGGSEPETPGPGRRNPGPT